MNSWMAKINQNLFQKNYLSAQTTLKLNVLKGISR